MKLKKLIPYFAIASVLILTSLELYRQGRLILCACGTIFLWSANIHSSDNSQHISDTYSFSHVQHGLIFYIILKKFFPKMQFGWRLFLAVLIESGWELLENSEVIIQRYRSTTSSLGYHGDTIINSIGDIVFCILGFILVRYIGWKKAIILFIVIEVSMIYLIRDSLLLNILMLISPIKAVKMWQMN